MHVHILTKVLDQKRGDLTYTRGQTGMHICTQLCKGDVTDMGCQVDKHTCTDVCTHSNQGTGPEEGSMDNMGPQIGTHFHVAHISMQLCKGDGAHVKSGSHAHIY